MAVIALFTVSFASGSDESCPSFFDAVGATCTDKVQYAVSGLTTFWGQEYAGIDLVRDEMKTVDSEFVSLAVMDLGFEKDHVLLTEPIDVPPQLNSNRKMIADHGTAMVNIINGPAPYGATDKIRLVGLYSIPSSYSYGSIIKKYKEKGNIPKVISNSLGWSHDTVPEAVQTAYDMGIFWFLASGNDFPESVRDYEVGSRALLVGSYSPYGWTSFETQNHKDLLVLSPADEYLATIDGKGLHSSIGQSSGGNAMAAATAANILSILPGLTHEQYRLLIKNTAHDSIENKLGDPSMPKLLNAYKAFKVARKIKNLCPKQDADCLQQTLNAQATYRFTKVAVTCASVLKEKNEEQKNLFVQLRKNTLLGVDGQAKELQCVYSALGFKDNAQFYQFITQSTVKVLDLEKEARRQLTDGKRYHPLYRFMKIYDSSIEELITNNTKLKDYDKKELLKLRSANWH